MGRHSHRSSAYDGPHGGRFDSPFPQPTEGSFSFILAIEAECPPSLDPGLYRSTLRRGRTERGRSLSTVWWVRAHSPSLVRDGSPHVLASDNGSPTEKMRQNDVHPSQRVDRECRL